MNEPTESPRMEGSGTLAAEYFAKMEREQPERWARLQENKQKMQSAPVWVDSNTRVYMICNAYESGLGHGLKQDNCPAPYEDAGANYAYDIGYVRGALRPPERTSAAEWKALAQTALLAIENQDRSEARKSARDIHAAILKDKP